MKELELLALSREQYILIWVVGFPGSGKTFCLEHLEELGYSVAIYDRRQSDPLYSPNRIHFYEGPQNLLRNSSRQIITVWIDTPLKQRVSNIKSTDIGNDIRVTLTEADYLFSYDFDVWLDKPNKLDKKALVEVLINKVLEAYRNNPSNWVPERNEGMNIEVAITRLNGDSSIKAFCDVTLDKTVTFKGFKIVQGKNGLFASPPASKNQTTGKWVDQIWFPNKEFGESVKAACLDAYNKSSEGPNTGRKTQTQQEELFHDPF